MILAVLAMAAAAPMAPDSAPRPTGNVSSWFTANDRVMTEASDSSGSVAVVRVVVDPVGKVGACSIARSSGSQALDARSCELIERRGQFQAGKPGNFDLPVTWRRP